MNRLAALPGSTVIPPSAVTLAIALSFAAKSLLSIEAEISVLFSAVPTTRNL